MCVSFQDLMPADWLQNSDLITKYIRKQTSPAYAIIAEYSQEYFQPKIGRKISKSLNLAEKYEYSTFSEIQYSQSYKKEYMFIFEDKKI